MPSGKRKRGKDELVVEFDEKARKYVNPTASLSCHVLVALFCPTLAHPPCVCTSMVAGSS